GWGELQFWGGVEEEFGVGRKDAGLHTIGRIVDLAQNLVKVGVGLDRHDRAEDFLAVHFHVRFGAGQHGGLDNQVVAAASAEKTSASANRFIDPADGADRITFADERANVGGLV